MEPEQLLGLGLVHRQRRCEHIGAGVGNPEHLQQALDAAVLAPPAVQRDERDFDLLLAERDVDVAIDVDRDGVVAALAQRREHRLPGAQGHLALAGQSSEQHTDLAGLHLTLLRLAVARRQSAWLTTRTRSPPVAIPTLNGPPDRGQFFVRVGGRCGRLDAASRGTVDTPRWQRNSPTGRHPPRPPAGGGRRRRRLPPGRRPRARASPASRASRRSRAARPRPGGCRGRPGHRRRRRRRPSCRSTSTSTTSRWMRASMRDRGCDRRARRCARACGRGGDRGRRHRLRDVDGGHRRAHAGRRRRRGRR